MKYLLIILLLIGCSAEKRCQKHLRKAEALGCISYKSDTIVRLDTIRGFRIDTFVKFHNEIDTLIVDSGGIKVVTIIKWKTKEIGQVVSKKDSVIQYLQITKHHNHTKIVHRVAWWFWIIPFLLAMMLILVIIKK
tara:strand:+ start:10265 stop:10669 length:405 start_codon:yes stop_codon:yes gene_type:complete